MKENKIKKSDISSKKNKCIIMNASKSDNKFNNIDLKYIPYISEWKKKQLIKNGSHVPDDESEESESESSESEAEASESSESEDESQDKSEDEPSVEEIKFNDDMLKWIQNVNNGLLSRKSLEEWIEELKTIINNNNVKEQRKMDYRKKGCETLKSKGPIAHLYVEEYRDIIYCIYLYTKMEEIDDSHKLTQLYNLFAETYQVTLLKTNKKQTRHGDFNENTYLITYDQSIELKRIIKTVLGIRYNIIFIILIKNR